jgi:hypothetical protein
MLIIRRATATLTFVPTRHCRKEFLMLRLLNNLITNLRRLSRRHAEQRLDRYVKLGLEAMEERLALSGSGLPIHPPVLAPARVGEMSPAQTLTHTPGSHVIDPLTPVHGYKWRRRLPHPYLNGESPQGQQSILLKLAPIPGKVEDLSKGMEVNHLTKGMEVKHVAKGEKAEHLAKGEKAEHLTKDEEVKHVAKGEKVEHLTKGHLTKGEEVKHVAKGKKVEHLAKGEEVKHVTKGEEVKHVAKEEKVQHLAKGGEDGPQVVISTDGRLGPHVPDGPLPFNLPRTLKP